MKSFLAVLAVPAALGLALWASILVFSALAVFNALVPVDGGVSRVAQNVVYGPDPRQRLDVYRPEGKASGLPVLVFCYGGAWDSGDRTLYDFAGRSFAAAGYITILFDYRLVPEARFPAFVEDTAAAIGWAANHAGEYGGDGSRIFLVGHSAGAYNVAMAALDPRYLRAAGVDPAVIAGVATLSGPFDFLPLDDPATIAAFGQVKDLAATQPVNAVSNGAPPFLLLTGDRDRTVYPRNSQRLAARLAEAGVTAKLVLYEGLGHVDVLTALARPLRWRAPVLDDIKAFFASLQTSAKRS